MTLIHPRRRLSRAPKAAITLFAIGLVSWLVLPDAVWNNIQPTAQAANFTVNTLADTPDAVPFDGICANSVAQALIDGLTNSSLTRASVLRKVVDGTVVISEANVQFTTTYGQAFYNQEFRRAFVYMEYIGYLRRNPDSPGFVHWLGKLNFFNGDPFQAEMVKSFILSPEYRSRFGQP